MEKARNRLENSGLFVNWMNFFQNMLKIPKNGYFFYGFVALRFEK